MDHYNVYLANAVVGSTRQLQWTYSGLACGTTYSVGVAAVDGAGRLSGRNSKTLSTDSCPATAAPSAPTNVVATSMGQTTASLSWQESSASDPVTGYRVYRNGTGVSTTQSLSYGFTGLTCGAGVVLGVAALDAAGNQSAVSSVSTSTQACSPPPTGGTSNALAWAPPTLVNPTTINVQSPSVDIYLDPTKDYILKMPSTPVKPGYDGGLWVNGGHNIVIIGGEFDFTGVVNSDPVNEKEGRVATFFNVTGTIHMEGIWAHGDGLIEGVQMYSPQATLQIENCRFDHLHTEANGYHSDLVQWGTNGGKTLRVDRFTGSSEVQGISDFGQPAAFDLRQVNLLGLAGSTDSSPVLGWLQASSVALQDFYVQPRPGESLMSTLRPTGGATNSDSTVQLPGVTGVVNPGTPPGGDYVPSGVAGTGYTSPGYQ